MPRKRYGRALRGRRSTARSSRACGCTPASYAPGLPAASHAWTTSGFRRPRSGTSIQFGSSDGFETRLGQNPLQHWLSVTQGASGAGRYGSSPPRSSSNKHASSNRRPIPPQTPGVPGNMLWMLPAIAASALVLAVLGNLITQHFVDSNRSWARKSRKNPIMACLAFVALSMLVGQRNIPRPSAGAGRAPERTPVASSMSPLAPAGAPVSPASEAAWLDDLPPVDTKPDYVGLFVVKGRSVAHGVGFRTFSGSPHEVSYDLGGHYATFTAELAIGDKDFAGSASFDILGDGTSLLPSGVVVNHGRFCFRKRQRFRRASAHPCPLQQRRLRATGDVRKARVSP